jgi:RNA polymerase sigma-70 factor (sigma-E family)
VSRSTGRAATRHDIDEFLAALVPSLMGLAVGLTGRRHDGEDLVQETLARVIVKWSRVRSAQDPEAYVRRMMINLDAKRRRRRWHGEIVTGEPAEAVDRAPTNPDPAEGVAERDALLGIVASLPPRQRAVMVLRYYADLPDAEIADTLGCTQQAVRNAAHAAMKRLRRTVSHAHEEQMTS